MNICYFFGVFLSSWKSRDFSIPWNFFGIYVTYFLKKSHGIGIFSGDGKSHKKQPLVSTDLCFGVAFQAFFRTTSNKSSWFSVVKCFFKALIRLKYVSQIIIVNYIKLIIRHRGGFNSVEDYTRLRPRVYDKTRLRHSYLLYNQICPVELCQKTNCPIWTNIFQITRRKLFSPYYN